MMRYSFGDDVPDAYKSTLGDYKTAAMRILLSYASQHDKGEGLDILRVLESMGHVVFPINVACSLRTGTQVKHLKGYAAATSIHDFVQEFGQLDLFLYIEPEGIVPFGLEEAPFPSACVISDVHRNLNTRLRLARFFDHVFLYQRNYRPLFTEHPSSVVHWWPWSCDTEVFRNLGRERIFDIGFVGQLFDKKNERRRILERLAQRWRVNELRPYAKRAIPEVYSQSKIVVNLPVGEDLNCRFFEALACGALLLTRRLVTGQEELFTEGVHYAAFSDSRELEAKVGYYLAHEEERVRIAREGHAEFLRCHSMRARLQFLIEAVAADGKGKAPIRSMTKSKVKRLYGWFYYRCGFIETLLQQMANSSTGAWDRMALMAYVFGAVVRRVLNRW